ncbi:DNA topoisomerase IB [Pseudogemmobacter humi]|uniref:DNA topoisomerase n=1 Tax=Pseudogemmobacter humi TaxID=2483812 RepID=A0A3P5XFT0_9RHOB|nr:DNA topoisomerase IB [Pseudogemmobacter humi]VDC33624.1 Eukaryotic DNA topoisomerase I, catalytic core [Pseudogemmobacter humi]
MTQGLVYVSDSDPGITRRRAGKGFCYFSPGGQRLSGALCARAVALAVPPAWEQVWICPREDGHIQATGRDARGRKQYLYHPLWQASRAETKYAGLTDFARALPALRRRLDRDLRQEAGNRDFTLAALVMLLDRAWLRIGNPEYTAQNGSFGAVTLRRRHLRLDEDSVRLDFRAKGGRRVRQVLRDRKLHRILHQIGDLPGRNLFTWLDEDGRPCPLGTGDVNGYLAEAMGEGVTARTFRTWGGTLAAFGRAAEEPLTIRAMAGAAALRLHNTPAICRSSYIHPAVLDLAALDAPARQDRLSGLNPPDTPGLRAPERRLLSFLDTTETRR